MSNELAGLIKADLAALSNDARALGASIAPAAQFGTGSLRLLVRASMKDAVDKVNNDDRMAAQKMGDVDSGKSDDLVGAMLSSQEASLSFSMLMQVRNKVMGAVDELIKLPCKIHAQIHALPPSESYSVITPMKSAFARWRLGAQPAIPRPAENLVPIVALAVGITAMVLMYAWRDQASYKPVFGAREKVAAPDMMACWTPSTSPTACTRTAARCWCPTPCWARCACCWPPRA
jgi:flagellar hook-basal body complex protein FliE